MSLNLKDPETVALVSEVAKRLGTTKTGAVRRLAQERLDELDKTNAESKDQRLGRIMAWLEKDVWPKTKGLRPLTKEEEEEFLGYNEMFPNDR